LIIVILQILQRKWMSENSSTFFMTDTSCSLFLFVPFL
jgi:hypothetical protein